MDRSENEVASQSVATFAKKTSQNIGSMNFGEKLVTSKSSNPVGFAISPPSTCTIAAVSSMESRSMFRV